MEKNNQVSKNIRDEMEQYASQNEYTKLVATYEAYSNGDLKGKEKLKVSMLYGYGLFMIGLISESKDVFEDCYSGASNKLELCYLLNYVYQKLGEFEQSIHHGKEYLNLFDKKKKSEERFLIQDIHEKAHEICNNLGTCHTKLGKYEEAVGFFEQGIIFNDTHDLLYENLGILLLQLGKYVEAEEVLVKGKEKCRDNPELPRILGLLYKTTNYFKDSEAELLKSNELGSKEALLDCAILYSTLLKYRKAKQYIKEFLKYNPDNAPAQNLLKSINQSPFIRRKEPEISVCMIVKNEEEMLPRCLESVRDIADELIVVDTGSTDKTVEIAESFGAKVYHHPWKNSFSEARNHTLKYATKEWVFSIDADEELEREDIPKILLAKWQKEYEAVMVAIYSSLPGQLGGVSKGKHYYPRFYRRKKDIYYYGIVHNLLKMPKTSAMSDIRLYHHGYDLDQERMWNKFKRSLSLLLQQVKDDPMDAFARFNIAQMYLSRNFSDEAEEHIQKALEILSPDDEEHLHIYLMSLYQLALVHFRRGELEKGREACERALKIKNDYIDPLLSLGSYYLLIGDYKKSRSTMRKFLKYRNEQLKEDIYSFLILNKVGADYEANYVIGEAYIKEGELEKAGKYLLEAEKSNPHFWLIYKSKGDLARLKGEFAQALDEYEQGIKLGYLNAERYGTLSTVQEQYTELLEDYKKVVGQIVMEGKKI